MRPICFHRCCAMLVLGMLLCLVPATAGAARITGDAPSAPAAGSVEAAPAATVSGAQAATSGTPAAAKPAAGDTAPVASPSTAPAQTAPAATSQGVKDAATAPATPPQTVAPVVSGTPAQTAPAATAAKGQVAPPLPSRFGSQTRPPARFGPAVAPASAPATPVAGQAPTASPATGTQLPASPPAPPAAPSVSPATPSSTAPPAATAQPPAAPAPPAEPPIPVAAAPPPAAPPAPPGGTRYITIDFDSVDIQVFIKFISELTGKNFIVDDKVKGKVTVISPRKISVDEAYKVFESVLDVYGFAAVPAGDMIKVMPAQIAREKNVETRLKEEAVSPEDKVVTQILALDHASPDEVKKVLDPLVSKSSVILSYPPTGMVIITDLLSNIKRLMEIVSAIDVDGVGEQITYLPLEYASSADMAKSLTAIFQQQAGKGALAPIKIVPDDRTNALVISATENDTKKVRELLKLMDKEVPKGAGAVRVYYLQNAKAEDLAKVLTSLPQQTKAGDSKEAAAFSKKIQIVADKSTNALVVTAEPADYLIIEDVIRKLDISRPMVYLEALIMEVNASKGLTFGVEWQGANEGSYQGHKGGIVGSIGGKTGASTIAGSLVAGTAAGLALGVVGEAISVAVGGSTITFPNLGAFIQAYQNDTDVRILSTPQLLTLDNEEAEITVGSNVPYVTRQDTTVTASTNYSSYEYKDVGVTLKVTPQINKDGFIRMKLDQSVTKIVSQSATIDSAGTQILTPTTLKRTAKTTVTIKDGETVVIGGMIEDNSDTGTYKVPLLGDIPLLGWLFKSRSRTGERNNLFVFITPRIIRTPEDAVTINQDKTDYMRSIREGTVKPEPARRKGDKGKAETPEKPAAPEKPTAKETS